MSFQNTLNEIGGAIYLNDGGLLFSLENVGFSDCSTTVNCGAFFARAFSINMTNVCGFMCEAINSNFQFFSIEAVDTTTSNFLTSIAISSCGIEGRAHSALSLNGSFSYTAKYINSTHNHNNYEEKLSGACFRICDNVNSQVDLQYFNFFHNAGLDIINIKETPNPAQCRNGNMYNNTCECFVAYCGIVSIEYVYFGLNRCYSDTYFLFQSSDVSPSHGLTIMYCKFATFYDRRYNGSVTEMYNGRYLGLPSTAITGFPLLDNCPVPSMPFTQSKIFTNTNSFSESNIFTDSSKFTDSNTFSNSIAFTQSNSFSSTLYFSKSNVFSSSNVFTSSQIFSETVTFTKSYTFDPSNVFSQSNNYTPTYTFTPSDPFTPSFTFSPIATKYPDGLNNRVNTLVVGEEKIEERASSAAIGVTTGLFAAAAIGVSVALILIYIKSRTSQVRVQNDPGYVFSDSTEPDSTYSYSFYTYEYSYAYSSDSSDDNNVFSAFSSNYGYSNFDGYYISTKDQAHQAFG